MKNLRITLADGSWLTLLAEPERVIADLLLARERGVTYQPSAGQDVYIFPAHVVMVAEKKP